MITNVICFSVLSVKLKRGGFVMTINLNFKVDTLETGEIHI